MTKSLAAERDDFSAHNQHCWACASTVSTPYKPRSITRELMPSDFKITDATYGTTLALRRCSECGFIFAEGNELRHLLSLYESLEDEGYEASQQSRQLQMNWLADIALRARPGANKALEIGAGTGLLVETLRRRGIDAIGVEPSRSLVAAARTRGVELVQGTFGHPSLEGGRFDLVFLIDVIEHVAEPFELLSQAAKALNPGGVVLVATPDHGSLARRVLRHRWWHFRLAHVCYFDRTSFTKLAQRCALSVERAERARWFFPAGYLLERLEHYVPLPLARWSKQTAVGSLLENKVVPLNLFDSWLFICRGKQ